MLQILSGNKNKRITAVGSPGNQNILKIDAEFTNKQVQENLVKKMPTAFF
jgi:hypothetical protein